MSERDLEPLPDEVSRLLEAERGRPGMPEAARDRLMSRLGIGGPGGSDGNGGAKPSHATSATPATPPRPIRLVRPDPSLGWVRAATFALGLAGGALLHSAYDHASSRATQPTPIAQSPTPVADEPIAPAANSIAPPAQPIAPVAAPSPAVANEPAPAPPRHRGAAPSTNADEAAALHHGSGVERDLDLGAERNLLEIARTSLTRQNPDQALAALERWSKQFPRGRLVEERETLWVQALVSAGRYREAKERGQRFRKSFPNSFFLPAVEAAMQSIP